MYCDYIHTIDCYSGIKGNELLIHATHIDFKITILSERSLPQST